MCLTILCLCSVDVVFRVVQQRKIQESARFQTLMESISKLEKSVEVWQHGVCGPAHSTALKQVQDSSSSLTVGIMYLAAMHLDSHA